jgi:glycosyltransferase involved in cell wall biosynthesis
VDLPPREDVDGVLVDRVLLLNPSLDQLQRRRPDLFLASLYYGPKSYWRLRNLFGHFEPDVVNVHFPDNQVEPILSLRKRFDFRLVVSLHGHDVQRFVNGNGRRNRMGKGVLRFRALLQTADAVTAVSQNLLNDAVDIEPTISGKSNVIHNGIDLNRFVDKTLHSYSKPYLLAFGRLVHKKGFDLLIDAFAQYQSEERPDLIIAGTGEEFANLQRQAENRRIDDRVHFFGEASADEVLRLLNGSVGVVVPSRIEPFGIVALEALAAGKPLLATETGGLQELLKDLIHLNGREAATGANRRIFLVKPTVQGIAAGLRELFDAINAASSPTDFRIPEKYTWPHVAQCYERILLGR